MATTTKQPSENKKIDFDFSNVLRRSDHSIVAVISITDNLSALTFTNIAVSGKKVQADVAGGTDDTVPKVTIQVQTNYDPLIEGEVHLPVIET